MVTAEYLKHGRGWPWTFRCFSGVQKHLPVSPVTVWTSTSGSTQDAEHLRLISAVLNTAYSSQDVFLLRVKPGVRTDLLWWVNDTDVFHEVNEHICGFKWSDRKETRGGLVHSRLLEQISLHCCRLLIWTSFYQLLLSLNQILTPTVSYRPLFLVPWCRGLFR